MKQSFKIITHIKNQPIYSKLNSVKCYEKIKALLPPRFQNGISFMYIKNDILFFALNHPALKMEFNYNLNLIKEALKEFKKSSRECEEINFKDVIVFVTNKIENSDITEEKEESMIFYKERSSGTFDIKTDNEKLQKIFKEIQKVIKNHS